MSRHSDLEQFHVLCNDSSRFRKVLLEHVVITVWYCKKFHPSGTEVTDLLVQEIVHTNGGHLLTQTGNTSTNYLNMQRV